MAGSARRNARSRVKTPTTAGDAGDEDEHNLKPNIKALRDRSRSKGAGSSIKLRFLFGLSIFTFLSLSYIIYSTLLKPMDSKLRVVTPFPAPKLTDLPQFQGEHKESLYWGTYRPHVYLGIRARTPKSLIFGLMWIGVKDGQLAIRHICQDSDGLSTYGWIRHNGRDYGHQVLADQGLTLETSFLKYKMEDSGYGGDWAVRVDLQSKIRPEEGILGSEHVFFYVGDETGHAISMDRDVVDIDESSLLASGSQMDVGDWQLHLKSEDDLEVHYSGFKTPYFHNLSDLVQANLADVVNKFGRLQLPNSYGHSPNVFVYQVSAKGSFRADVVFVSGTNLETSRIEKRVNSLTGGSLDNQLIEKQNEFDNRFERCFNLTDKFDSKSKFVGKAALSNLLGGIGYFYGQSKISLPRKSDRDGDDYAFYWPAELYTAVPSRSFFPRGFLWDEGFHQVLIWHWDINICLDIIGHWLDLMNIDGWIPREQILGAEALSKVPAEYVVQHPTNGNPPTLFLVLHDLAYNLKKNKFTVAESSVISSFLERAFVRLDAWFKWFNTTQSGKNDGAYFWHGRDNTTTRQLNPLTLTSGLDDYPRASHPNDDERHVDLRCWMLLAADSMRTISELLKKGDELEKEYGYTSKLLSDFDILNQMHFSEADGAYYDFGNHTEKVRLSWQVKKTGNYATRELLREVIEKPKLELVPHLGYVSLFPFMGRIIPPDSWILEKQLDLISSKSTLWSNYGIRSLSKTSSIYMKHNSEHDAPYWRGPIWMNMNYMILSALDYYSKADGPYKARAKSIYDDLRGNLISTVVNNYYKSGYIWEQYDQKTGMGKGQRPFTGWTTLVLLIMAEAYSDSWGMSSL